MSGKRTFAVLTSFALLLSMAVGVPAVAQSDPDEPQDIDHGASAMFDKVLLEDDIGEPMTLDIASDGRIFLTDRSGQLRIHDPETGETTMAAEIDTYDSPHYPGGNNEGGLLGAVLDPDFDDNQWIYLYYSDPVPDGDRVFLSRFEMDGDQLDEDSEIVLLEVESQREACCHLAGDLEFDPAGNLYISTGDETLANCADQYAPINEDPNVAHCDAQGTAGNSADLRGKILRITPEDDGTYSIPDGNLYPQDEYDPEEARPEIYVQGARNPFRMAIDDETGWLYYGMYGPNNPEWHDERGPIGFDQWHQVREASHQGWPFCTGNLYPYRPWDFDANEPKGDWFDCENGPVNESPNNTGLTQLPPVEPAFIYYPLFWDNYPNEVPEPFLNLGTGAGGPNGGPIYRYDEDLDSDTKFPEHFDGQWFILDSHRDHLKTVEMDENGDLLDIHDFMDQTPFAYPHDADFGPDGSLYILEYGNSGGFQANPDNGLYRIDWVGESDEDVVDECYETTVTDDFDGDELDRDVWPTIVREDPDGYELRDGSLVMDTLLGDMIRDTATAQNLILQPLPDEGGWQATTEFTLNSTGSPQQAGLIVYDDDANFIKAPIRHPDNLEFLLHVDQQLIRAPGDVHTVPEAMPHTYQLRLTSDTGENVRVSYSADGTNWVDPGVQHNIQQMEDPQIGLLALRGPNEGDVVEAEFHSFELALPVSDAGPNDDFEGDELDRCIWPRIVRHDPGGYSVGDGSLSIATLLGDMIINVSTPTPNARNLILQPLPDGVGWEATTEISIDATENHQHAGLVIYGDDGNFIKAALQNTGNFEFLLHEDGELVRTDDDVHQVPGGHPGTYQIRLTSDGPTVSIAYSLDEGDSWTEFGSALPLPDDAYIGPYAARGPNEGEVVDADFHWFTLDEHEPVCPDPDEAEAPEGFEPLFDGETLDGWTMAGPGGFEIDPCGLLQPWGGMGLLWYEAQEFDDYVLETEFRVQDPADNSGVFVNFPDPDGDPWNPVDEGFEIQIYEATDDPMTWTGSVYTFAPAEPLATNEIGEWNTMRIEVVDQDYTVTVNDVEVASYTNEDEERGQGGYVGLQNHAAGQGPGDGVEFRGVWIQDLTDDPGEPGVEATLDPAEPDGEEGWYVSPVTVTLEADDDDAVIEWRDAGGDWTTYTEPFTIDEDGVHDLEYRAVLPDDEDDDGATDAPDVTEAPTVMAGPGEVFVPDEVTVALGDTVTFEAAESGHNVVIEDADGEEVGRGGDFTSSWTYEFTADEAGEFTFDCEPHAFMDGTLTVVSDDGDPGDGDEPEIHELSFQIDQTPPETDVSLDGDQEGETYTGDVSVTLDATDATSGVAETHHRVAGDDDHEVYDEPITVSDDGEHTIEFRSVDVAGNVEEWRSVTFTIDSTDPDPDPPAQPSEKDDCKGGGWRTFSDPSFRNQGQCVSWVATGAAGGGPGNAGNPPGRGR